MAATKELSPSRTDGAGLDTDIPLLDAHLLRSLREAKRVTGRTTSSIGKEIFALKFGSQKISPEEYFIFRLFRPELSNTERASFIGRKVSLRLNLGINKPGLGLLGVVQHKFLFERLLSGLGLPTTETLAIVQSGGGDERTGSARSIASLPDLRSFLENADLPIFGKPVGGSLGLGSIGISGFLPEKDSIITTSGESMELGTFFDSVAGGYDDQGYVLQRHVRMHSALRQYCGKAVGTVRVVMTRLDNDFVPLYAVWKIPGAANMEDHYWRSGNMFANIDVQSGEIVRCHRGISSHAEEIEVEPGTGAPLKGLVLPDWPELLGLASAVARAIPELGIIGLDIAPSDRGPVMVEANPNPHHAMYQLATDQGLLNPAFKDRIAGMLAEVDKARSAAKKKRRLEQKRYASRYRKNLYGSAFKTK